MIFDKMSGYVSNGKQKNRAYELNSKIHSCTVQFTTQKIISADDYIFDVMREGRGNSCFEVFFIE